MDNKEIIEKLRALKDLLRQHHEEYQYYEEGCAQETLEQIKQIMTAVSVMPGVPAVAKAMPVFPVGEEEYKKAEEETNQSSKITLVTLLATAGCVILWLITKAGLLAFLSIAAGVAWFMVNKTHKNNKAVLAKKEKTYNDSLAHSKASFEAFNKALSVYDREVKDGIEEAGKFGQFYREKYQEHQAIMEEFSKKREQALEQCCLLTEQMKEHDYIPLEYYHHIPSLITLLQSGRADNYKEALNMAIEEERQDAMEVARQEEEARRLAAMERQAEEERRHNMMMERQQAEHNLAMERTAKAQAEEQRRANMQAERDRRRAESEAFQQKTHAASEARKEAAATRAAGVAKCANCANNRRCSTSIKESGAGLTCGGYRPR